MMKILSNDITIIFEQQIHNTEKVATKTSHSRSNKNWIKSQKTIYDPGYIKNRSIKHFL